MSHPLDNFLDAYDDLHARVGNALRTQVGDAARLNDTCLHVLAIITTAELVCTWLRFLSSLLLTSLM